MTTIAKTANACIICDKTVQTSSSETKTKDANVRVYVGENKQAEYIHERCLSFAAQAKYTRQETTTKPRDTRVYEICRGDGKTPTVFSTLKMDS